MKRLQLFITVFILITLISCGNGTSNQPHTAAGFGSIEKEFKSKFGKDAYYTDIHISYNDNIGNIVTLTVTEDPASLKMEQWNLAQNSWTQAAEVTLEIPGDSKATDFMFQLNEKINLTKFGRLVEKSSKQLIDEKDIENPALFSALFKYPKDGDISDAQYNVSLKPENGGATFHFYYTLDEELIKMDY